MNHNIFKKIICYDLLLQVPLCEDESVQLFRVAFCRSDFLQNPYFSAFTFFLSHHFTAMKSFILYRHILDSTTQTLPIFKTLPNSHILT